MTWEEFRGTPARFQFMLLTLAVVIVAAVVGQLWVAIRKRKQRYGRAASLRRAQALADAGRPGDAMDLCMAVLMTPCSIALKPRDHDTIAVGRIAINHDEYPARTAKWLLQDQLHAVNVLAAVYRAIGASTGESGMNDVARTITEQLRIASARELSPVFELTGKKRIELTARFAVLEQLKYGAIERIDLGNIG